MSSIQQGIQSAHAQMELFVKYPETCRQKIQLFNWAQHHKTMIVLNGGYLSTMKEALEFIDSEANPYPFATFHESEEAMGGMLTNIAIVLPEKIYETSALIRRGKIAPETFKLAPFQDTEDEIKITEQLASYGEFSDFEKELCYWLTNFGLAS